MSFRRDWRRLTLAHPRQPWGLLLILLLGVGIAVDTLRSDCLRLTEQAERSEMQLLAMRKKVGRLPAMEEQIKQVDAEFGGLQSRLLAPGGESATGEKLGQSIQGWYAGRGIAQATVRKVERRVADGLVHYRVSIDAPMRIEQLVQLMQNKPHAPLALGLVEASVEGNDAKRPTGLRTAMIWEAVQAPAKPEEKKAAKPANPAEPAAGKEPRPVSRSGDSLTAQRVSEDKRK